MFLIKEKTIIYHILIVLEGSRRVVMKKTQNTINFHIYSDCLLEAGGGKLYCIVFHVDDIEDIVD